jgi:hypothetical protein
MPIPSRRLCLVPLLALLSACVADPPAAVGTASAPGRFEPAPMPSVRVVQRGGTVGVLQLPIPPKMPPGTGAVPVSNSPVRGSIVTGFKESF